MAVDVRTETLISLREAARICAVEYATVYGWATRGVRGRKLEVAKIGPRHMRTSREAIERWIQHFEKGE